MVKSKLYQISKSSLHGKGVFARTDITKDTKIIEYVGERITKKESQRLAEAQLNSSNGRKSKGQVYIFEINKRYDIDGNIPQNKARRINHSCSPNCVSFIEKGKIWIYSLKKISEGDELTYDYGFSIDTYEEHPCACGSRKCLGYIVRKEDRPKLKRLLEKKKEKEKAKKAKKAKQTN
jgi:SET domain-containing protein